LRATALDYPVLLFAFGRLIYPIEFRICISSCIPWISNPRPCRYSSMLWS